MSVNFLEKPFHALFSLFLDKEEIDAIPAKGSEEWEYVRLNKRDGENRPVKRRGGDRSIEIRYDFLMNNRTGDLYLADPNWALGTKFYALLFGVPLSAVMTIATNAVFTLYHLGQFFFDNVDKAELKAKISKNIRNIYLSPWFATGMWIAAFYGLTLDQWKARVIFSKLECKWREMPPNPHVCSQWITCSEYFDTEWTYYLAFCFQPTGNIDERRAAGHRKWHIIRDGHDPLAVYNRECWDLGCNSIPQLAQKINRRSVEHRATRGSK